MSKPRLYLFAEDFCLEIDNILPHATHIIKNMNFNTFTCKYISWTTTVVIDK